MSSSDQLVGLIPVLVPVTVIIPIKFSLVNVFGQFKFIIDFVHLSWEIRGNGFVNTSAI